MYRQLEHQTPVVVAHNPETKSIEKIPYVPSQRMMEKMTTPQKEGVRIWNLMRDTLIKHGLMEENN